MRLAIVKDARDIDLWGDKNYLWGADSSLENFIKQCNYRIQGLGLIDIFHPDVLVIQIDSDKFFNRYPDRKEFWGPYFNKLDVLSLPDFSKYDVVICTDPWLNEEVIRSYPKTLFCYWDHEKFFKSYADTARTGLPLPGYDLHLDHLSGPEGFQNMPASVYAHYPAGFLHFDYDKESKIATDRRTLVETPRISECLSPCFPPKEHLPGLDYLKKLSECKYFIYLRPHSGGSGQAAMVAASVGCVVIGHHWAKPFQSLSHPFCKVDPSNGFDFNRISKIIESIEKNDQLYQDILYYQDQVLMKDLWRFENNLQKALDLKWAK